MSHLKNKSEINMDAAQLLLDKGLYPSCCHPAYYGCIQLMKYILNEKAGINYKQQEIEISLLESNKVSRKGSHNYLIDKLFHLISQSGKKEDKLAAKTFKNEIEDLKRHREIADYKNEYIGIEISTQSIQKAKSIHNQLSKLLRK